MKGDIDVRWLQMSFVGVVLLACCLNGTGQARDMTTPNVTSAVAASTLMKSRPIRFPANLNSLNEIFKYQMKLGEHQDIEVRWNSMNGATQTLPLEAAQRLPVAGDFSLIKQTKDRPGSPGGFDSEFRDDLIVIVGIADSGEIRSLTTRNDPRHGHSEDFRSNPIKRSDFIDPIAVFRVQTPNDPSITQLLFFQTVRTMKPPSLGLKLLGKLNLNTEKNPSTQ